VLNASTLAAAATAGLGDKGDLYAVLMLTPLTLVLGEIVPKSVFQQKANELTRKIVYPLYAFSLLLYPIVLVFSRSARLAARLSGHGGSGAELFAVREQLRTVLDTAEGAATINIFDRQRIRNVVRFGELAAADAMIPASEMNAIDINQGTQAVVRTVRRTGISHLPVFEGRRSQVVGMVSASVWDIVDRGFADLPLRELVRPACYVPTQQPLVELLPILRKREDQSAIVVDEFGSAVGIISVDAILETVVGRGEVGSTFEEHTTLARPGYTSLGNDVYLLDARLPIPDVNELLGTRIDSSAARTIGGLVVAHLRHVPGADEFITDDGYRFTVVEASDRAVTRVRAERLR
jgi:CBS domain containing-hemolysin-like protein